MKQYHAQQAKYWAATARAFYSNGYMHTANLFKRYADEHAAKVAEYED